MKLQCCFCKNICCNHEYDEMLDCEIALEESGKPKCYQSKVKPFYLFDLEEDEEVCKSYLKAFNEEYGLYKRISNKISDYIPFENFMSSTKEDLSCDIDIPFENFMSSAKEEWDDRPKI